METDTQKFFLSKRFLLKTAEYYEADSGGALSCDLIGAEQNDPMTSQHNTIYPKHLINYRVWKMR